MLHYPVDLLTRFFARSSRTDGRWIIVAGVSLYLLMIAAGSSHFGYVRWCNLFGVPAMSHPFVDASVINAGVQCSRLGYDVLDHNPCTITGVTNYPRLWLVLGHLGLDETNIIPFGLCVVSMFFAGLLWMLNKLSVREGYFWTFLLCSSAVMLGVERGNIDLCIFAILAVALVCLQSFPRARFLAYILIFMAALLKLFPILAVFIAIREPKKYCVAIVGSILFLFLAYMLFTWRDILLISARTPRVVWMSFGCNVFFNFLKESRLHVPLPVRAVGLLCVGIAWVSALILAKRKTLSCSTWQHIDSFRLGAIIYEGVFIIGNNYDYRLVFLLFTVPQLIAWTQNKETASLSCWLLIAIACTLWSPFIEHLLFISLNKPVFFMKEASNWLLFGGFTYFLISTLPFGHAEDSITSPFNGAGQFQKSNGQAR